MVAGAAARHGNINPDCRLIQHQPSGLPFSTSSRDFMYGESIWWLVAGQGSMRGVTAFVDLLHLSYWLSAYAWRLKTCILVCTCVYLCLSMRVYICVGEEEQKGNKVV